MFKYFPKNIFKDRCRLEIGSTFIFKGYYCIVTKLKYNWFEFIIQENNRVCHMSYKFYLTTPSAAGRKLNR